MSLPTHTRTHAHLRLGQRARLGLALTLCAMAGLFAAPAALAKFGLKALRQNSSSGAVDYLYTAGNSVLEQGTVDRGRYYRFDVYDPSGTVRWTSACRSAPGNGAVSGRYTLQASDPDSNLTAWRFRLREWNAVQPCGNAATPQNDTSLYFDVASATSYTSSALSTAQSAFGAGKTAYVQISGAGSVKSASSNTTQTAGSWSTTWLLPSGATACANTAGADMPGSSAVGQLPSSTAQASPAQPNLQYPAASGSGADPWNLSSNYETGPCPALSSANQGSWSLRLGRDSTHFVVLPVFSVLTAVPHTTLASAPSKVTAATTASFTFTSSTANSTFKCSLDGATPSLCTSPQTYSGLTNGAHTFSVAAVDPAGNVDPNPATAAWTIDTTSPPVTLSSPAAGSYTNNVAPTVSGTAETKSGDSGVTVKLYAGTGTAGTPIQTLSASVQAGGSWSVAASTLTQGVYTVQAQQTNAVNTTGYSPAQSFTVDTMPPAVSLYTPISGTHTNDTMPQITGTAGTAAGDLSTVNVTVSGTGSPVQTTADVSSSGTWNVYLPQALADGAYTVQAAQQDLAGNTGYSYSHIVVDTTPPQTSLDGAPVDVTSSTTATFSFHATDALSQAGSTFQCQLDGGNWSSCSPPQSYFNLANGLHTFSVQAVDGAGNVDTTGRTTTWTINTLLPSVTLSSPSQSSVTNNTQPMFSGAAGTAAGDASTVQVLIYSNSDLTGSPIQTLNATVGAGAWNVTPANALGDGTYVAYAQQTGTAGIGTSNPHTFTVNTQPPTTTIDVGPAGNSGTGAASFSFSSSESGSTFQCQLDGTGWSVCASPQDYLGLGNGSHTFQVRAVDAAGNVGAAASQSWSVNTNLPALTLTSPTDGAATNNQSPAIAGSGGTATGDASTVTVNVYSGTSIAGTPLQTVTTVASGNGAWTTHPSSPLPDGTYTVYAQQVGSAGTAYTQANTFTIETVPPTTSINSEPQGLTASTSARFTFAASSPGATFQCQLDGGTWTTCTSPESYGSLAAGTHSFSVRATDPAGNVDPNPPLASWTVDPTVPVTLTAPVDGTVTNNTVPTFSGAATAANGPVSVEIEDLSGGTVEVLSASAGSTWSATASPSLPDGTYTAFASQLASDGVTTDYSGTITFTVDTTPPVVTLTTVPSGTINSRTPSLGGAAGTASGDAVGVTVKLFAGSSASGTPVQTLSGSVSAGSWSATPTSLADGTYTARAEQSDSAGNTGYSTTSTFSVDATPPTTSITSGPAATTSATSASFSFTASELGSTFQCRLDGGSWTRCTSPQSYSSLTAASHSFSVRATDPAGNVDSSPPSQSWTITSSSSGGTIPSSSSGGTPTPPPTPPSSSSPSGSPASTDQPAAPSPPSSTPSVQLTLRSSGTQHLGRKGAARLVVTGSCSKSCTVILSARVISITRSKRGRRAVAKTLLVLRLPGVKLIGGKALKMKVQLSSSTRAALARALTHKQRLTLTLTGTASAPGMSPGTASLTIRLVV